jgi:hypothetical protein
MRRLLLALTTAVGFCVSASPAVAANPIAITDPAGDGTGVADITRVTVEDTGTSFTFTLEVQNLVEPAFVGVFINSDRNRQTGATDLAGTEYILLANDTRYGFLRWTGVDFEEVPEDLEISFESGRLTFAIPKALMANTQKIDLVTVGGSEASATEDVVPNTGVFTYLPAITRLVIPAAVSVTRAGAVLDARAVQVEMTPAPGQTLSAPATLRCTLSLGGRTIRALAGGCRWRIPRAWRGRRLTLRITATGGRESRTQTVTVRVR